MQVKFRHHLRSDAVADIEETLSAALGIDLAGDSYERVEFADSERDLVLSVHPVVAVLLLPVLELLLLLLDLKLLLVVQQLSLRFVLLVE